jgi:hypothetical protein
MKTFRLLNDCSHYHAGSALVAHKIRKLLHQKGLTEGPKADVLVVNGEGTFHHDAPSTKRISEVLAANRGAAKVFFVNGVWQNMTKQVPDVSFACLRDSLSEESFKKVHPNVETTFAPDISLTYELPVDPTTKKGVLFIDSVDPKVSAFLKDAAARTGSPFMEMCKWAGGYDDLIRYIAVHEAVVTGRYHGATLSAVAGVPFTCAPSNTWKTRALLRDFGKEGFYHKDVASVLEAVRKQDFCLISKEEIEEVKRKWEGVLSRIASAPEKIPVPLDSTCVLVGNGPSLMSKKLGGIIDAYDEVVRFNSYKTVGFEKHTGRKTTVWSTFGKGTLPESPESFNKVLFIHGDRGDPATKDKQVFRIPISFYEHLRSEIRSISTHKKSGSVNPTSGFLVARWLLAAGVNHLSLAGFDHFSKAKSGQHHYWDAKAYGRPEDHDGDAERLLLLPWLHAGRLSYLT